MGFLVIDRYLERPRRRFSYRRWRERARLRGRLMDEALAYRVEDDLLLVKPLTYMNRSGVAVRGIVKRFELRLEDCLIVYDDFDIPWGRLRAKAQGGSGGHKGMASIIEELGSAEIPRLRIGIRGEGFQENLTDYVLGGFTPGELGELDQILNRAVGAIDIFYENGIERMMEEVNRPEPT